ncbi:hypothetical protein D9M69_678000 [compost metagenome]
MSAKPTMVISTVAAPRLETAAAVGSTPSMIQGCRPTSATIQPHSAAIQGRGIASTATRSSQG